jgi:dipeptidyl aminopeptidase/acylaminoacyl peptidase
VSISPDGDYLAFDRRTDDNGLPDVFVISTDGRRETPVAQTPGRDAVVGWSADGAYLLLTTERDGLNGLWAQPMRDGRPSGRPELLQADVSPTPVGVTSSGDAYFSVDPSTEGIYIASGDLSSATFQVHGTRPIRGERPEWSPDGTAIAYADIGRTRVRNVIAIQDLASGKTRRLELNDLNYLQHFVWTPDGRAIIAKGQSRSGRPGLFRIDAGTGEVATIALQPGQPTPVSFIAPMPWSTPEAVAFIRLRTTSPGRGPGIREPGPDAPRVVLRDVSSGDENELIDLSGEPWATFGMSMSPDRKFAAARSPGPTDFAPPAYAEDPSSFVVAHDLTSGRSRRIWTAPFSQAFSGTIGWLPDSSAVIVVKLIEEGAGRREAWVVSLDGSEPRKLDLGLQNLLHTGLQLSPDGRRMAIMAGDRREREVQVLSGIVPRARR